MEITLAGPASARTKLNQMASAIIGKQQSVADMIMMLQHDAGTLLTFLGVSDDELRTHVNFFLRQRSQAMPPPQNVISLAKFHHAAELSTDGIERRPSFFPNKYPQLRS